MSAEIKPLHHVTLDYPVQGHWKNNFVRILVTADGILMPLVEYFLSPANRSKSQSWQRTTARAVGYFYDFTEQASSLYRDRGDPSVVLSEFAHHLISGTMLPDGSDELGLFWPKQQYATVETYIKSLTNFSDFCVRRFGKKEINPFVKTESLGQRIAIFRAWDQRNQNSLLSHVSDRKEKWLDAERQRLFSIACTPRIDIQPPLSFPVHKFFDLISDGFRLNNPDQRTAERNYADILIALLQGSAGFRESEPFHLFVDDIIENPLEPGSALVRIHHPTESKVHLFDKHSGKNEYQYRSTFLASKGLCARNTIRGKSRAGWKDPLLIKDNATGAIYMEAYWFPKNYGEVFWHVYQRYLMLRRKTDHPFLFINKTNCEPYRIQSYLKKFELAVRSIGLPYGKSHGTTPHGLRHMYGQSLRQAKISREIRQKAMHHKNPKSTDIYAQPTSKEISDELNRASASWIGRQCSTM